MHAFTVDMEQSSQRSAVQNRSSEGKGSSLGSGTAGLEGLQLHEFECAATAGGAVEPLLPMEVITFDNDVMQSDHDGDDLVVYNGNTASAKVVIRGAQRRRWGGGSGAGRRRRKSFDVGGKWRSYWNIEPVLLLSNMSYGLFLSFLPIFIYWSRCTELFIDKVNNIDSFCSNLSLSDLENRDKNTSHLILADQFIKIGNMSNSEPGEDIVQLDVANLMMYMRSFRSIPSIISCILLGAWSDKYGERRLPLIISFIGPFVANFIVLLCTLIYKSTSIFGLLVVQETIAGFTGGGFSEFSLEMAMVTDQSSDDSISLHVGIATGLQAFGMLLGQMGTAVSSKLAGEQNHAASYVHSAIGCAVMYTLALIYLVLFVDETAPPVAVDVCAGDGLEEDGVIRNKQKGIHSRFHPSTRGDPLGWSINAVIHLTQIGLERLSEVLHTLKRPRKGWLRFCIITTVALVFIELLALDNGLLLLYVKRPPLAWSDLTFTYYVVFTSSVRAVGQMFVWPYVASKAMHRFGPTLDTGMVCIGLACAIVSYGMLSVSTTDTMVFLAGTIQFFTGMMSQGFRSFLPKMVDKNETARIYTAVGIVVMVAPIPSSLIFNSIYKATLHIWSGFAFFVVALMQIVVLAMMGTVHLLTAKKTDTEQHEKLVLTLDTDNALAHIDDNQGDSSDSDPDL